jgi:hypothetical protein
MRKSTLIAVAATAFAGNANAQDIGGTINLELGTIANHDPVYDVFSDGDGMASRGIRGGVRLNENISVIGGWHRVRQGSEVFVEGVNGGEDATFTAALFADELSLGVQAGVPFGEDVFFPYVGLDGMLFRGVMKFDEDTSTKKNSGQVISAGAAPGILPVGGVEFRSPTGSTDLQVAFFLEMGHTWFTGADFGDIGMMKVGGLSARGGVGLRF